MSKSKWLVEWEAAGSDESFGGWMVSVADDLKAKLESMERLREAVKVFRADRTWDFAPPVIGWRFDPWVEVIRALEAAQKEQEDE